MSGLLLAFQILLGLVAFVSLHELGPVLMARSYGDRDARFTLVGRSKGQWLVATAHTRFADAQDWPGGKVALAGPLFTRLVAEGLSIWLLLHLLPPALLLLLGVFSLDLLLGWPRLTAVMFGGLQ